MRVRTCLSQANLAGEIGVSEVTIRSWETGLSTPKAENLWKALVVFISKDAFTNDREVEEAKELWLLAQQREKGGTNQLKSSFDEERFRKTLLDNKMLKRPYSGSETTSLKTNTQTEAPPLTTTLTGRESNTSSNVSSQKYAAKNISDEHGYKTSAARTA